MLQISSKIGTMHVGIGAGENFSSRTQFFGEKRKKKDFDKVIQLFEISIFYSSESENLYPSPLIT